MEQMPLRLLCRLDAPSVVPSHLVVQCRTYREAVILCWNLRKVRNMTKRMLAERCGLYAPHVTQYLAPSGKHLRDLPAEYTQAVELACDNTAISQWHAMRAQLSVLEELQAQRSAA